MQDTIEVHARMKAPTDNAVTAFFVSNEDLDADGLDAVVHPRLDIFAYEAHALYQAEGTVEYRIAPNGGWVQYEATPTPRKYK